MKRKNLFITIFAIVVAGLGLILFLGEALSQELEQQVASPIEPTAMQKKGAAEIGLVLSGPIPLFLSET